MEVIWSDAALADIEAIYDYIVLFNPSAAASVIVALRNAANGLTVFPDRGRPLRHGQRELATVWPYIIRYKATASHVVVLRVRHGRRRPLRG